MQTYWPNLWSDRTTGVNVVRGESIRLSADWKAAGTVVSSSWQSREISTELSDPNLVGTVTDVLVKANGIGTEIIDNVVVLSTGETRAQRFEVEIVGGERLDLSCPLMTSPGDGATLLTPTTVLLSWTLGEGVTAYGVYLWADGDTRPVTPTYTVIGSSYTVTGLDSETLYNWAITAIVGDAESLGCGEFTFTTAIPIPLCPVLVSPADGLETDQDSLTFEWLASDGAASYNLYVTIEGESEQLLINTTGLSYDATGLTLGVDYTWRVTAVNITGESSGCGSRSFTTRNTVLLSAAEYSAVDTDGFATIVILRTGTVGEVTADYATADDTAVAPTNYTATTGTVTWPDGDSASRPVQIPIQPLPTVIEYATDVLYPWLVGHVADPRNPDNGHAYNFAGQSYGSFAPANHGSVPNWTTSQTEAEALESFATEWEAELPSPQIGDLTLVGHWPKGSGGPFFGDTGTQFGPYSNVSAHEKLTVTLHYNEIAPATYEVYAPAGGDAESAHYTGIGATAINAAYRLLGREPGSWFMGPESGAFDPTWGAFRVNRPFATTPSHFLNGVLSTIDGMVECRRVPVAPPVPHADEGLPDWEFDSDFWYDESVDEIYSKEVWTKVVTPSRWLAKLSSTGTPEVVTQYPIGPARPVGHADDTEAAWTAAYNAAVTAGTVAAGKTFNLAGTGGVNTYPRNADYYYVRSYKLPLWFTVNLTNPVGAELMEPDTATVYIFPA